MQKDDIVSFIEYSSVKIKVEINNDICFYMSRRMYKSNRVQIGDYINLEEYQEWYAKERKIEALQKSVNLLAIRARSTGEIKQSLQKKEYDLEIIDYVINRLLKEGFLNDAEFTFLWVESRIKQQIGKNRIKSELIVKHVPLYMIEEAFEKCEYENLAPIEARKFAEKYIRRYKDKPIIEAKHKTIQALARKGYSFDMAKIAVNNINIIE